MRGFLGFSFRKNHLMKTIINSPNAPSPVGPYNQAVLANGVLYGAGQIALDPATGNLVKGSIEEETHQVLKNIKAVLSAAEMNFEHLVKCSVFVSDMELYGRINNVYSQYFNDETAPARELVEVANLPKYVNIEISFIAVK